MNFYEKDTTLYKDIELLKFLVLQQAKADKWFSKEPSIVNFDDRFQFYQKITEEIEKMPVVKQQECITLHMSSLQHSVQQHVVQWVNIYGKLLHTSASTNLFSLRDEIEVCPDYSSQGSQVAIETTSTS